MVVVAIGFVGLLEVDVADLHLRFGRLFHLRIEQDEVLVLSLSLRPTVRAGFAHPAVGDGQLGLGQVLAGVVGIHQGVQGQARDLVAAVLDVLDGLVEEDLVRLLSILGDRILVLLVPAAAGDEQGQQH